jgi:general secretion pathway protein G
MSRNKQGESRWHDAGAALGFTLLELMVVLLILALLATIAAPRVTHYLTRAKIGSARIQVDALGAAVDAFNLDVGRFPTEEEGLRVLVDRPQDAQGWDGPYLRKRESLIDPWRHPYRYRRPGKSGDYDVFSWGADGKEGGEDDASDVGTE